jgi:hypothetical protein
MFTHHRLIASKQEALAMLNALRIGFDGAWTDFVFLR